MQEGVKADEAGEVGAEEAPAPADHQGPQGQQDRHVGGIDGEGPAPSEGLPEDPEEVYRSREIEGVDIAIGCEAGIPGEGQVRARAVSTTFRAFRRREGKRRLGNRCWNGSRSPGVGQI